VNRTWYFGVYLVAAQLPLSANVLDYWNGGPTSAQIDEYLTRKNSPLAGLGPSFASFGRDYNVDPRLIIAIAGAETTFGHHICAEKNAWNWFYRGNCPDSPFATYEAGLERVTRFMRLSYLNRGYDSIELIRYKYCAVGCENWVSLVTAFRTEMPSDAIPSANSPTPRVTASPGASRSVRRGEEISVFGLPVYLLFFVGALFVAIWAFRLFR